MGSATAPCGWLLALTLVLVFNGSLSLASKHENNKLPSAVVVGTVYCDTCFQQDFSWSSHFISGASVSVECKDSNSKLPSFYKEARTNEHGVFKVPLPLAISKHVKRIQQCSVRLIRSNEPFCAVASSASSSSLHLKSRKEGTHIFSAGFFTFKPLKQPEMCKQKPSSYNKNSWPYPDDIIPTNPTLPNLPFPPPLPNLPLPPPLPNLPPLPTLPPLPNLPPLSPLPQLPGINPKLPPLPPGVQNYQPKATDHQFPKKSSSLEGKAARPDFFFSPPSIPLFPSPPPLFGIPLPPNPFQPPPLVPNPFQPPPLVPNPFQPPPLVPNPFQPPPLVPNPFQPPPLVPNPFQPPPLVPNPFKPAPPSSIIPPIFPPIPIPFLTPPPPPPALPFPFPPSIPILPPGFPGIPPAASSSTKKTTP